MFRRTQAAFAVALLLPALLCADDASKTQDKDLNGEWEGVAVIQDGEESPPVLTGIFILTFDGENMIVKEGGKSHKCAAKLDPSKTPKTIDVIPEDGPQKGKTILGIYEIKGDELHMCQTMPGKDRPTEISSKKGSGYNLMTFKRVKK